MEIPDKEPPEQMLISDETHEPGMALDEHKPKDVDHGSFNVINQSSATSVHCHSVAKSDDDSEPFPDYYESCGEYDRGDVDMRLIKEQEDAYNHAISKVVEEVIRFREIDARIATLSSSMYDDAQASIEEGSSFKIRHWGLEQTERVHGTAAEAAENNDEARGIIDEIRALLVHPHLRDSTRKFFISMTDMVLQLNILLFPTPVIPTYPTARFTEERIIRATNIALQLTEYLLSMNKKLQEYVNDARQAEYVLSIVTKDTSISTYVILCRVVEVVRNYLNRAVPLERELLFLFFELYDAYIYTAFLNVRPCLHREVELADEKIELSRVIISLWDIVNQDIETYDEYARRAKAIKRGYVDQIGEMLRNESPEAWREFWESQRMTGSRNELREPFPVAGTARGNSQPMIIPGGFL